MEPHPAMRILAFLRATSIECRGRLFSETAIVDELAAAKRQKGSRTRLVLFEAKGHFPVEFTKVKLRHRRFEGQNPRNPVIADDVGNIAQ